MFTDEVVMCPVIRVSDKLFTRLEKYVKGFGDTPCAVIERILDEYENIEKDQRTPPDQEPNSTKIKFWQEFSEFAISNNAPLQIRPPTRDQYYCDIRIGRSECHISLTVLTKKNQIGCQLYIPNKKTLFKEFLSNKETIEENLAIEGLLWEEKTNACRIQAFFPFDFENQNREDGFKWYLETANKFKAVFSKEN
ncbi:DUF4268 domain-containing protein [Methylicorpusculum oleiharenae]|uniref:DUF4268 domain-containing protein n=1 Tax=Methylicorpusculum oleiharenae TaxID=1338687 RepID=UPI0019D056B1|nr:DUF4268 domain-containing protein [Methylicorpusculum oleiharenae]MCD2453557.1 DUF4268 domain-containing protein [Methylicorpusculum oleiharenae]